MLLTDGETTVGRPTEVGAQAAADAGIPVFTIAFGTAGGSITDPATGESIPVPVQPAPLTRSPTVTGGAAYEAATERRAHRRLRAHPETSLGATLGEEVQRVTEVTWRGPPSPGPPRRRLGPVHVVAPGHGLTVSVRIPVAACDQDPD